MVPSTAEKYKTGEWQVCWDGGDVCSCVLDGQGGLRNKLTFEQICRSRSNSKYKGLRGKIESQIRKLRQTERVNSQSTIYLLNQHLLNTCYVPSTIWYAGKTDMNDTVPDLQELAVWRKRQAQTRVLQDTSGEPAFLTISWAIVCRFVHMPAQPQLLTHAKTKRNKTLHTNSGSSRMTFLSKQ